MPLADLAQPGSLSNPTAFAEYLTFTIRDGDVTSERVSDALSMLANATKSIAQKDSAGQLSSTIGFSARAWPVLFPGLAAPAGLVTFPELTDGPRHFPSTPGDIFIMVKSARIDLALQAAKYLIVGFSPIADVIDDTRGFQYLDNRDLIDFVDGTENPANAARVSAVCIPDGGFAGGSFLVVQKYIDRQSQWDAQSTEAQEGVIGRTKLDDIEIADDQKMPYAHNVKSKVVESGVEIKMYRQNRAIGTAHEHGTMFVGFAASLSTITTSLRQMITADDAGFYDHLLDFVDAVTGGAYFVPPQGFLDQLAE